MRHETLVRLLRDLDLWPAKKSGEHHYVVRCLFPSKHAGYDRKPSATVSHDLGVSWFTCWSCGTKRPLLRVVEEDGSPGWSLIALKYRPLEARDVRYAEIATPIRTGPPKPRNCSKGLAQLRKLGLPTAARDLLTAKNVDPDFAWRRFLVAFVPEGHCDEFMGVDENGEQRCARTDALFTPTLVRTPDDRIACIGGQARPLTADKQYFTLYPYSARHYLYGEHLSAEIAGRPVCYVEGQFDVMHLWQLGFPALGLFGLHMSDPRALKATRLDASEHCVFLDPDRHGDRAVEAVVAALAARQIEARTLRHDRDPKWCDQATLRRLLTPC